MNNAKKILLISSNIEEVLLSTLDKFDSIGMKTDDDHDGYPLGLAYLHSYLEHKNHIVETLFLNNYGAKYCFDKVAARLAEFNPDIVGFQVLTQNRLSTYSLVDYIEKNYPQIKIVLGGIHSTIMYRQLLEKFPRAIVIRGEGEITLAEVAEKIDQPGEALEGIDGVAYCENGEIKVNPLRALITDLDALPFPKHELFFKNKRTFGIILTARGCPFSCSFCSLDLISRKTVRKRSIANVLEEIEWMIKKFPQMTDIWIQDDTFFVDNQRVIDFCDEIIRRGIKLNFICSARFKPISQELVAKIKQANFVKIYFGLESGDNEILKRCHKNINQADILAAIRLFKGSGITIYAHLIVGLPGETIESIRTTAKLVQQIQRIEYINYNTAYLLTIYPGTEVYEIAKEKGLLDDSYWLTDGTTPIFTAENSLETLYYFKETLLNRVSAIRAFTTWEGFASQFFMIPYHLAYALKSPRRFQLFVFNCLRIILGEKVIGRLKSSRKALAKMRSLGWKSAFNKAVVKVGLAKLIQKKQISYSQCGEDLIIAFAAKMLKLDKPTYLDIGAFDYKKMNNTYLFYKNGSSGVCIEPDPLLFEKFKAKRPFDACLNVGITAGASAESDFFLMSSKTLNTFSKAEADKNASEGYKIEKSIKIRTLPINELLSQQFKSTPNIVSLDIEGLDLAVLKSLDFSRYRPEIICVETIELNADSESKNMDIMKLLEDNGYINYADTHINTIFVDRNKWQQAVHKDRLDY